MRAMLIMLMRTSGQIMFLHSATWAPAEMRSCAGGDETLRKRGQRRRPRRIGGESAARAHHHEADTDEEPARDRRALRVQVRDHLLGAGARGVRPSLAAASARARGPAHRHDHEQQTNRAVDLRARARCVVKKTRALLRCGRRRAAG